MADALDSWGEGEFDQKRFRLLKDSVLKHKKIIFRYMGKKEASSRKVQPHKFEATFAIDKCMAYRAYDELPVSQAKEEENRFIFTISKAHESWFYDYIFSYGPYAEVLGPIEVRIEMKKRAEGICKRYQD